MVSFRWEGGCSRIGTWPETGGAVCAGHRWGRESGTWVAGGNSKEGV